MSDDVKSDWVLRNLGVDIPLRGGPIRFSADEVLGLMRGSLGRWRAASEAVDRQIAELQAYLRTTGDAELGWIADQGLNGMMGGRKVALLASLHGLEQAGVETVRDAAPAALPAIEAFADHIAGDRRIAACDRNQFGVAVAIREQLTPALADLRLAFQTATGEAAQ